MFSAVRTSIQLTLSGILLHIFLCMIGLSIHFRNDFQQYLQPAVKSAINGSSSFLLRFANMFKLTIATSGIDYFIACKFANVNVFLIYNNVIMQ